MLWTKALPSGSDRQMEIKVLGQTSGCILTFSHVVLTVCRYARLFKEAEIHTGADAQNTTFRAHTNSASGTRLYSIGNVYLF